MTIYIKYQCSVCRRNKDIERDTLRATPNKCTITKGCAGFLLAYDDTIVPVPVIPLAGIEDWYPRGQTKIEHAVVPPEQQVGVGASLAGAFVVAVKAATIGELPDAFDIQLLQRRQENVEVQDYTYRPIASQTVFTGRDVNGKILRIDDAAIVENRVLVRVNGVLSTSAVRTINTITFPTPIGSGSVVSIRVQLEKETVERTLRVTRNDLQTPAASRGGWSNVKMVQRCDLGVFTKWWLFSADVLSGISIGKMKVITLGVPNETMVLLAHTPFESIDRYLSFVIPMQILKTDFLLNLETSSSASLVVPRSTLSEIYPPLLLDKSLSFVVQDVVTAVASSEIIVDGDTVTLESSKILGPQ